MCTNHEATPYVLFSCLLLLSTFRSPGSRVFASHRRSADLDTGRCPVGLSSSQFTVMKLCGKVLVLLLLCLFVAG